MCVIADDIIDTAGTIQKAAQALKDNGATRVLASAVHGVLSGPAIEAHRRRADRQADRDQHDPDQGRQGGSEKIVVLSVARLLAQAIRSIHEETSVSKLFV